MTKTTSTSSTSTASTNDFTEVASCEGTSAAGLGANVPSAQASFTHQQTAQFVFELVGVFPSASTANRTYGFFSDAKAPTCVGQLLAKSIASGATGAGLTASKITTSRLPFPREGSATTALKLAIPLTVDGESLQMNADFIVIRSGKKIAVLGEGKHPLYKALTAAQPHAAAVNPGEFREHLKSFGQGATEEPEVLWNFEKFLLSRKGEVVARFSPETKPESPLITKAVEAELAK